MIGLFDKSAVGISIDGLAFQRTLSLHKSSNLLRFASRLPPTKLVGIRFCDIQGRTERVGNCHYIGERCLRYVTAKNSFHGRLRDAAPRRHHRIAHSQGGTETSKTFKGNVAW